jgi:hypothetical protein
LDQPNVRRKDKSGASAGYGTQISEIFTSRTHACGQPNAGRKAAVSGKSGTPMFDLSRLRSRVIAGIVTLVGSVALAPPGAAESAGDWTSIPAVDEQLAALNLPPRALNSPRRKPQISAIRSRKDGIPRRAT